MNVRSVASSRPIRPSAAVVSSTEENCRARSASAASRIVTATPAPEGRQIIAQRVSAGKGVKARRAPERGGRVGGEPDLSDTQTPAELARMLYDSLRRKLLA